MGIIDGIPGLQCNIRSDGRVLTEYWPDYDSALGSTKDLNKTVVKYIEAEAGKSFEILVTTLPNYEHLEYTLLVKSQLDGEVLRGRWFKSSSMPATFKFGSIEYGDETKTFKFSDLSLTENPRNLEIQNFGSIVVRLTRLKAEYRGFIVGGGNYPGRGKRIQDQVSEKDVKGRQLSVRTELAPGAPSRPKKGIPNHHVEYIDSPDVSFEEFTFIYGSRTDLEVCGVIPRSPSPEPLDERSPESLTPEETQQLQQLKQCREQTRQQRRRMYEEQEDEMFVHSSDSDDSDSGIEVVYLRKKRKRYQPKAGDVVINLE